MPSPQPIPPTTPPPPSVPPTTAPPAPQRPEIPIPKGDPDSGAQYAKLVRIIRRGVKLANRTQAAWDFGQWIGRKIYEKYGEQILDAIDAVTGRGIPAPDPKLPRRAPPRFESPADRRAPARAPARARARQPGPLGIPGLSDLFDAFGDAREVVRPKRRLTRAQRIRYGLPVPSTTPPIAPAPAPVPSRTSPRFDQVVRRVLDTLPSPTRRIDRVRRPSPLETPWPTTTPSPFLPTPLPPSVPLPTPPSVVGGPSFPSPFVPPSFTDPSTPTIPDLALSPSFSGPTTRGRNRECRCEKPRRKRRGCTNPVVSRRKRVSDGRILITTTRELKCPPSKLK